MADSELPDDGDWAGCQASMRDTGAMSLTIASGPWRQEQVESFLVGAVIPVRLASLRIGDQGQPWPVVQSLWFAYRDSSLWCATQAHSALVGRLRRDPSVGFEVSGDEPPYRGVRGSGRAEVLPDAEQVLADLILRYGQQGTALATWLLGRVDSEVAIRISHLQVSSWDYAGRMASREG